MLLGMAHAPALGGPAAWLVAAAFGLFVAGITWISRSETETGKTRNLLVGLTLQNLAFLGLMAASRASQAVSRPLDRATPDPAGRLARPRRWSPWRSTSRPRGRSISRLPVSSSGPSRPGSLRWSGSTSASWPPSAGRSPRPPSRASGFPPSSGPLALLHLSRLTGRLPHATRLQHQRPGPSSPDRRHRAAGRRGLPERRASRSTPAPSTPTTTRHPCGADRPRSASVLDRHGLAWVVETGARYLLNPRLKHDPTLMDPDPARRAVRVDFLRRAIDLARRLEAECVSFWSGRSSDDRDRRGRGAGSAGRGAPARDRPRRRPRTSAGVRARAGHVHRHVRAVRPARRADSAIPSST